ncbi:MAG TPA: DNA topoisomerase, partial [Nitrososphaera sp.]|nr:DNA topoisomerase [Nitrososphaera sp.]
MPYTLVVCEKPDAARRIAQALGSPAETRPGGISVFDVTSGNHHYKVCTALGHLYGLADATKNRSVYPVLDLEWAPVTENPRAARAIKVISDLAKNASGFVHACDYDQEGEVIGHSILQYACNGKYGQALRAKFSTLTDDEIKESFANLARPNGGLAEAGRSRHMLDFIYGVNLSRALAKSFKTTNRYRNLSIGRVQGPTLAFAVDRELEIRLHVPDPYWTIAGRFAKGDQLFDARYEKLKVETLAEAKSIVSACTGKDGAVSNVSSKKVVLRPPTPFNIGDLQREAYRLFKVSPGYTLSIAEKLYLRALISYPRTSSQKLPQSIGYGKIISGLSRIGSYG